jgi:Flp pilus assembly protein TadD
MPRALVLALSGLLLLTGRAAADEVADGIQSARAKLEAGDADGCIAELEALREAHPDDPRPLNDLAYALFTGKGEMQKAIEHLADSLAARPGDRYPIELLPQIAFRALDVGDPELARYGFRVLMEVEPDKKEHRYHWAFASYRMGQRDSVRSECRRLLVDYPSFDSPYWLLARALLDEGRYEEVVRVYRDLSRERSGDAKVWNALGSVLLWNLRDFEGASESYRNALEIADPGSEEHAGARFGLDSVEKEIARSERLGERMRFLGLVLYVVLGGYAVLFLALAYLSGPPRGSAPPGDGARSERVAS